MRRIVGYRFPATKSGGFTTKPLIAVPSRLLKLIGSTGPSLTRESHASFWRDSGRSVVPSSANTSAGANGEVAVRAGVQTAELQTPVHIVCRLLLDKKTPLAARIHARPTR